MKQNKGPLKRWTSELNRRSVKGHNAWPVRAAGVNYGVDHVGSICKIERATERGLNDLHDRK